MNPVMAMSAMLIALEPVAPVDFDPITIEFRASTLDRLLQALTEKSGVSLTASDELSTSCVAVWANSAPFQSVLDDLANVLQAEWVQESGQFILRRNAETRNRLVREAQELHTSRVQAAIRKIEEELLGLSGAYRKAFASVQALSEVIAGTRRPDVSGTYDIGDPANLLLKELLAGLGSEQISRIPLHRTQVWSNRPTLAQSQLPNSSSIAVATYLEVCEALRSLAPEITAANVHLNARWQRILDDANNMAGVDKVLLFVSNRGSMIWALVALYDPNGGLRSQAATFIQLDSQNTPANLTEKFDREIVLTPDAERLLSLWPDYHSSAADAAKIDPTVRDELKSLISNPNRQDPLSYAVTDAIFSLAGTKDVVAYIPDELLSICYRTKRATTLEPRVFWSAVASNDLVKITETDNRLLLAPKNPVVCEKNRINRSALGAFLRSSLAWGYIRTEDLARLHFAGGDAITWDSIEPYRMFLLGLGVNQASALIQPDLYRPALELLGSLSDAQLAWMRQGHSLDIRTLSPKQIYFLMQWATQHAMILERTELGANLPDLLLTGTEAMASGPPQETLLSMRISQTDIVSRISGQQERWPDWLPLTSSQLAMTVWNTLQANPGSTFDSLVAGNWRIGQQEQSTLTVFMSDRLRLSCSWTGIATYSPGKLSYGELPQAFRDRVENDLQRLGFKR